MVSAWYLVCGHFMNFKKRQKIFDFIDVWLPYLYHCTRFNFLAFVGTHCLWQ